MRLSTRGRYGTRFMLDLALHYGNGPVLLRDVSERQEVSVKYLEQLAPSLKTEGLVKSTRGPHGGYHLAKPPAEITLYDIVKTLEGKTFLSDCVDDTNACPRSGTCAAQEVWSNVSYKVVEMLQSTTLEKMAERQQEMEGAGSMASLV